MSATADPGRAGRAFLVLAAIAAPSLSRGADVALPGKVELSTVDIESLLDLPVEALSRRVESTQDAPGSVFVLAGEDLRAHGVRTLGEALRMVPGLFTYEDGLWPSLGVRGLGLLTDYDTRILFLVDGHPMNDSLAIGRSYIGRDLPVPMDAVRRIEVIKGPVGGVYGATAFLGAVNIITQAPGASTESVAAVGQLADRGTTGGEVSAGIARGSASSGFVATASIFGTRGTDRTYPEWSYLPGGSPVPGNTVSGVDTSSAASGYLRGSALGLDGAGACGAFTRRLPSAPYQSIPGDRRTDMSTLECFAQLSADRAVSDSWTLGGRVSYDDFEYRDAFAFPPPPDSYGLYRDLAYDRWVTGELRARWSPSGSDAAHVGIGVTGEGHRTLQHPYADDLPSLIESPADGVGLGPIPKDFWKMNAWLLGDVLVARGLRLHLGTTFTAHEIFGQQLSSKAAAVWRPTPADTVKLVYAEGFRPPTASEAFYEDGTSFIANPGLRPELVRSVEAIYERRIGGVASGSASVFWNRYTDLIQFVTVSTPNGPRQQAINAGARTVRGVEAALTLRWEHLQGWAGVSVQKSSDPDEPNAPSVIGTAALSTRWPWRPLQLAAHVSGVSGREKDHTALVAADQRTSLPGYAVVGAAASVTPPAVPGLSIELAVSNVLDGVILHPVSGDFSPISEMAEHGRTVWLGARWAR